MQLTVCVESGFHSTDSSDVEALGRLLIAPYRGRAIHQTAPYMMPPWFPTYNVTGRGREPMYGYTLRSDIKKTALQKERGKFMRVIRNYSRVAKCLMVRHI